jgi:molybdopterin converting factor small subunit
MHIVVKVPPSLRAFAEGRPEIRVDCREAITLREVFTAMHALAPGVVERALDERGEIRPHVNVFLNGESIRAGSKLGLHTPVPAGAEVWILPAVSGGQASPESSRLR